MTIKYLSSETEYITDQTVSGLDICLTLVAKSATSFDSGSKNEYLSPTPKFLDPSNIHIKTVLKRNNKEYLLISENLAVLSRFATITQGRDQWENGLKLTDTERLHAVYIPFSGNVNWQSHINVKNGDVLQTYVNVVKGAYGASLDANACICEVRTSPSIGIEKFIPYIKTYSIRGSQANDLIQMGNNVTRVALLAMSNDVSNLPKAFTDVSLTSDRLDKSFNANQLILEHSKSIEAPENSNAETIDTYLIHEDIELDQAKLNLKMNPQFIKENTNYVVYSTFDTSIEILQKAREMQEKHESSDIGKLPVSL